MQAAGQGTGGAAGDADGPGGPGVPGGPGGYAGGPGEAGAVGDGGPQGAGAARASGPGGGAPRVPRGSAASAQNGSCQCGARGAERRLVQLYITIPFSSPMEAELVRRILSPDATPLPRPGAVLKDFTVSGNLLFIRLTAADHRQLQLSISSCLQQLSLLMWIVQCFLPVFLALLHSGQRR
ncbi:cancer/testis antigen 1-like isoform X1 [Rhinopithecus roxellana]|uniref:cancer/testis antigen 1-like isoform X1 n=1 Tax=Rhinopithecus roxellana TaxID=61622 RepID=UPI0005334941|nr:cancer/testis antigen 1-like isoform X1 [Rhinopithecus roxellana]